MGTKLSDKLNKLDSARRSRIEDAADRETALYLTLQQLRKSRDVTQVELAEAMGVTQETLSKMERRNDILVSSAQSIARGLGGKLHLLVEFEDRDPVILNGLGDEEEELQRVAI